MKKTILYIAMSLDGYVADKSGNVDWLGGDDSDKENMGSYPEFIDDIGTVILGKKTYNQIVNELSPEEWPYQGKMSYVLTHHLEENKEEIVFTDLKLSELLKNIKEEVQENSADEEEYEDLDDETSLEEGENIWICGGAEIVNQAIADDLIDVYCISIIPTILGEGIPLFNKNITKKLRLISTKNYNGIVDLVYERR